jgi:hypothetical protein
MENPIYIGNLSKCKKFGKMDLTTRKVEYEYADFCRLNICKCGVKGRYFESKEKSTDSIPRPIIIEPTDSSSTLLEEDTKELMPSDAKLD